MGRIGRFSQRYGNMKVRSQVGQSKVELEGPAWRHFSNNRATIVGFPRLNSAVDFTFSPFVLSSFQQTTEALLQPVGCPDQQGTQHERTFAGCSSVERHASIETNRRVPP